MNLSALHAELTADPESLGYAPLVASADDASLAVLVNQRPGAFNPAKTWTAPAPQLGIATVLQWAATGPLAQIKAGQSFTNANAALQNAVQSACTAALSLFGGSFTFFDVSDPANLSLLALLVANGVITQAQSDALVALKNLPASRAEVLFGIGTVLTQVQVESARKGNL